MCSSGDCVMDARIMCTLWLVSFYRDYISAADHGWWWIIEGFCRWGGIIIKADLTLISWYLFYGDHIMNRIRLYCWSFFNRAPYYSFTSHCYVTYLHFEKWHSFQELPCKTYLMFAAHFMLSSNSLAMTSSVRSSLRGPSHGVRGGWGQLCFVNCFAD